MRCAIYFIPPADDPLTKAASGWLGRDAYTGARMDCGEVEGLVEADRAFLTAPVRRFGLHATIKAPFRLSAGDTIDSLSHGLDRFSKRAGALVVPEMSIRLVDNFFALAPVMRCPDLTAFAADVVTVFDRFRAPPTEAELGRRDPSRLTERQYQNLVSWGYPHCMDQFRFHLPLTGPVPQNEREHVLMVLKRHFGGLASAPVVIDQLALFCEPEPDAPYRVHSVHRLMARSELKRA